MNTIIKSLKTGISYDNVYVDICNYYKLFFKTYTLLYFFYFYNNYNGLSLSYGAKSK